MTKANSAVRSASSWMPTPSYHQQARVYSCPHGDVSMNSNSAPRFESQTRRAGALKNAVGPISPRLEARLVVEIMGTPLGHIGDVRNRRAGARSAFARS
jgi:hypothetical protein